MQNNVQNYFPWTTPRPGQIEVINQIIEAFKYKKYVLLEAPTGIGKSVIAYTIANYFHKHDPNNASYILTSKKDLQEQYINDFEVFNNNIHISHVKGAGNYLCDLDPSRKLTCDIGVCKRGDITDCTCEYTLRRNTTYRQSNISVLNYRYFLNMGREVGLQLQSKRKFLVCDEAHSVESEVINWATVNLDKVTYDKYKISPPIIPQDMSEKEFIYDWYKNEELERLKNIHKYAISELEDTPADDPNYYHLKIKENFLDGVICISNRLFESKDLVLSTLTSDGFCIKPLYSTEFCKQYLFSFGEKILLMSATIGNKSKYCEYNGISENEVEFIKLDSPFKKEQRPILNCSIDSFSYKNMEQNKPKILNYIKNILEIHTDHSGIIHTQSYALAEYLFYKLNNKRVLFPHGKNKEKDIRKFLNNTDKKYVILSPSMKEGYDLKDDISRFSVVVKTPFASLGDKFISKRMSIDKHWYKMETAKDLIQMTGRSIRSDEDWAITYLLDYNTIKLINSLTDLPEWWTESIINIEDFDFNAFNTIVENLKK